MDGVFNTYGGVEVYAGCWWGNLRERVRLEDQSWEVNIKLDLQELGCGG